MKFSATKEGRSMANPLHYSEVSVRKKLMETSIVVAKGTWKRATVVEYSMQDSSKKVRTSSMLIVSDVGPRPKFFVFQWSDELALEVLLILPLKFQNTTSTFHKFQMDRQQSFKEANDCVYIFTTTLSQTGRTFGVAIEAKALFKNLQSKNKEFVNKASQAEEAAKKAKVEVEALKKQKIEESMKLASHWKKMKI